MPTIRFSGGFVLVLAVLLSSASQARGQAATGAIAGTVTDSQSGVLPGATVTVLNVDTGIARTTVSDGEGRYRVPGLAPGRYDVTAEIQGFAPSEVKNLALAIGLEVRRDFTLGLDTLQESVIVSGEAPNVEPTKAEVTAVVTQQQIESLPVAGRSAILLSLILPGTGNDTTRARRPGANVGIGGVSAAGTNYIVDGMNNMISRMGDAREDIPQAAIQEFRVIVSQAPAQYGGRVGGVVTVVTKSGGNLFTGEAFEFLRNKHLNRVDSFQQALLDQTGASAPDFQRNQYGFSIGGPIVKDRLHFFGAYERLDDRQYFTVATGKPQYYSALEGTFRGGSVSNSYFGRTDAQLNRNQHLFFRYFKQTPYYFCDGCGGTNAAFSAGDTKVPGFSYIGGHTWVVSPRVLNEFTIMYAESFQDTIVSERFTPSKYYPGGSAKYVFPSVSWGGASSTYFRNLYKQFREAVSISAGNHTFKTGAGVQILPTFMLNRGNPYGTWTFSADQAFNPDDPNFNFAALTGATQFTASLPAYKPTNLSHTFEAYAQDEWRPWANLTLNLGLRYDLQTKIWHEDYDQSRYPRPLPYVDFASRGDRNNVAPRLGAAWDVNGNARTIVRGGYGVVYTNVQNSALDGETNAFQQFSITIRNPSYPDPYQGRDPLSFASTAPPNITIGANNLVNAPATTWTGGYSQDLGHNLALHFDGIKSHIEQMPLTIQINNPDPVTGVAPLPSWGRIGQAQPVGTFDYRAFLARLEKRFSNRNQYTLSYTLAKQEGYQSSTDAAHPSVDYGPADNDRRHTFVASGSVLLPYDVTLGTVWTVKSALPFSAAAGKDLNNDGSTSDYVPGTTKNEGNRHLDLSLVNAWRAANGLRPVADGQIDSNVYNRLDVRASKAFPLGSRRRLELIAQVFNVLGIDNLGGIGTSQVTNSLSDSFGRILSAQPRQQAELAARFVF